MTGFQYRGLRWLRVLGFVFILGSVPLLYFWYEGALLACVNGTIALHQYEREAARHYKKALEYVLSGQLMQALKAENPQLLKFSPREHIQEATRELDE